MIIRKPYAFLIKYFKLIHLFLLLLISYILYKTYNIYNFFNDYVTTRQTIYLENLNNIYIPFNIFLISIIILLLFLSIYILFRKKDKPKLLYILGLLYYFIFIIMSLISKSIITTILIEGISPQLSRIIRDIWLILLIVQICFEIILIIRTTGFDIKKFDFKEDIESLKITDEDNEEIEIYSGFDSDKLKVKIALQKEDLKAFYYENKLIIFIISFILLIIIPGTFISKSILENKRYEENEIIKFNDTNITILNTYYTKKDYKNNIITKNDNVYLIIKFNIGNNKGINLDNLRLEVNDNVYTPNTTYYNYFIDIEEGYKSQKLSKNYIAVYLINEKELKNKLTLRYTDKIVYKDKIASAIYKRININPVSLDKDIIEKEILINQKYKFEEETINKEICINNFLIQDKFDIENSNKIIINNTGYVLKLNYVTSDNSSIENIIKNYGSIKYIYNEAEYNQRIKNIKIDNNSIYLAVEEEMKDASKIKLKLIIRNNIYIWNLK